MFNNIEDDRQKISPSMHISSGLSPSKIIDLFDLDKLDLEGKEITDLGGGFSNFSTYLKINYDISESNIVDPILDGVDPLRYYDNIDDGFVSLKTRKSEIKIEIEKIKTDNDLEELLSDEKMAKLNNNLNDLKHELQNIEDILCDRGNDLSMFEFNLNSSSALSIRGIENGSQDFIFMSYVIRHFKNIKDKKKIFENIYKILKDSGALYISGHKNYGIFFENKGLVVNHSSNAYGVKITKRELGQLIDTLD